MNFTTKKVKIVFIGDSHLGNVKCDEKLFYEKLEKARHMNNTYIYLMGDLIDNAISYVGEEDQWLSVEYQLKRLKMLIQPIKHKIIGCILGNHEWRTTKKAKANLLKEVYEGIIGIPVKNFGDYFTISVGSQQYRIITRHPSTGGTTIGWITGMFKKESRIIAGDYDLMVFGHFHRKLIHKRIYMKIDGKLYTKWDCISGHFLDYYDGYAHQKLLTPHEKGCIIATFYRDEHKVEVEEF